MPCWQTSENPSLEIDTGATSSSLCKRQMHLNTYSRNRSLQAEPRFNNSEGIDQISDQPDS